MARLTIFLFVVLIFAFTGGCTRIPQPTGYQFKEQHKMQAAYHWDVLASDVANQINTALLEKGLVDMPVYVEHSCGQPDACGAGETFPFDEGFNDLLRTRLVALGVPTMAERSDDALTVDYKVQVLYHSATRYQIPRPGVVTALTAGIVVLRDAPWEVIALAGAAAADTLWSTGVVNGHYEVIITTSIVDSGRYLMRSSDIYYINDPDFWHYRQNSPAPELRLTGALF